MNRVVRAGFGIVDVPGPAPRAGELRQASVHEGVLRPSRAEYRPARGVGVGTPVRRRAA